MAAGLALIAPPAIAPSQGEDAKPRTIAMTARPIPFDRAKPDERRFGSLIWVGTLELASKDKDFGGYSALAVDGGGRLIAISDAGRWLTADLVSEDGRPARLTNVRTGPLRGIDGRPLKGKRDQDAEALTFAKPGAISGKAYIGFERRHRIAIVEIGKDGVSPVKRHLPLPDVLKRANNNAGVEALTVLTAGPAKGALLALTEEYLDGDGNHIGWLIGGPSPGPVALKRRDGYAVTDATSLPGGDIVILERRFLFTARMRLRRIKAADIRPGALLDGEVLLEADALREIDNMEALAAHADGAGRTVLTIMSDDNFNHRFQRTLLMQFALPAD